MIPDSVFTRIARDIEKEWGMAGLTGTVYEDYAREILRRYLIVLFHVLKVMRDGELCD